MEKQFIKNPLQQTGDRIKNIDITIPKIRAEFYVRLTSFLGFAPEITEEGYEFYIKDTYSEKSFSAALTAFGTGYFAEENSKSFLVLIDDFNNQVFNPDLKLVDCSIEIEHDFGKSIFSCKNGVISEIDIEE